MEVSLAVTAKDHVAGRKCEHVGHLLNANQAVLTNAVLFRLCGRAFHHLVHGRNKESTRAGAYVKNLTVLADVC